MCFLGIVLRPDYTHLPPYTDIPTTHTHTQGHLTEVNTLFQATARPPALCDALQCRCKLVGLEELLKNWTFIGIDRGRAGIRGYMGHGGD